MNISVLVTLINVVFLIGLIGSASAQPTEEWQAIYDSGWSDRARDIAVDVSGNIYVTGYSYLDYCNAYNTIKYDSNGNDIWHALYDGISYDGGRGIAVDVSGNVYVTGTSNVDGSWDFYTIKYDAGGNEIWHVTYDGGPDDYAWSIAADASGNIYVIGSSYVNGSCNFITIKYDAGGNEIWQAIYNCVDSGLAYDIAVDASGNVYVTGTVYHGVYCNFITIKYDADGNEIWHVTYDGGSDDRALGIAVDVSGNVYVTGYSYLGNYQAYNTIKYDSNGNELWHAIYDGGSHDVASDIAVDVSGNIYVTGRSNNLNNNYDYYTIKYDSDGYEILHIIYDGGEFIDDYAEGIAVDINSNIYVTGESAGDYCTIKYSQKEINNQPIITNITATPYTICPEGSSIITVIASDPDSDTLSYSYTPTDGEISGSGSVVTWTAPPNVGTYRVDVTVSDGEKSASDSIFFTVVDPISIDVEWFDESDEMVVPYDEVKLKFTIKNNLPTTLHNVKLLFQSNTDLITLEKGSIDIGSIAPGEENSDAINSIIIEGVDNENILNEIINADGAGELFLTNSIGGTVEYDSGSQGFTLTPTDEYNNPLYIQYPDFSQHLEVGDPDLEYEDENIEYYREGDDDFSHIKYKRVRKYAVKGAATDPDTKTIGVFPDNPKDVSFNVFRYVDDNLEWDNANGSQENDEWIVGEIEKDTLENYEEKGWICITHAYLFTSFERALGFPSREITVAEGFTQIGPVTYYEQNGAAEIWHSGRWNFYDPWTSRRLPITIEPDDDILAFDDLLTKTNMLKYKAWNAFDKQISTTYRIGGSFTGIYYKGHIFGITKIGGFPHPFYSYQWKFLKEDSGRKSSVIIAGSPIKMLVKDNHGRIVGSTDAGIINDISGAKYMPPGQIGYLDKGDPNTAFELDEFISLPYDLIGDYELIIKGTDNGDYKLQFAKFDPSVEEEYSDVTTFTYNIEENEIHRYEVSIDDSINPVRILPVNLDIKPGSCTNPVNTKSKGVISAAILGMEDFDVTSINPETILLGRDGIEDKVLPIHWSYEDCVSAVESCDNNDINGDGYADLIFKFDSQTLVNTLNLEEATEEIISLTLTGDLEDENVSVEGEDSVLVQKQN